LALAGDASPKDTAKILMNICGKLQNVQKTVFSMRKIYHEEKSHFPTGAIPDSSRSGGGRKQGEARA